MTNTYPDNWDEIATKVKDEAGWRCVRCRHPHESPSLRLMCKPDCDFDRHPEVGKAVVTKQDNGSSWIDIDYKDAPKQRVLTVHHLDGKKYNVIWWNLVALCQVCHLIIQAKIKMEHPWMMLEHSEWFKPYVAGYYAFKYLGKIIPREVVIERMDELLSYESDGTLKTPSDEWFEYIGG